MPFFHRSYKEEKAVASACLNVATTLLVMSQSLRHKASMTPWPVARGSAVWRESCVLSIAYRTHNNTTVSIYLRTADFRVLQCAHCNLQPINFVTLMRVTNNASCNWVNLVQFNLVQFVCYEQSLRGLG